MPAKIPRGVPFKPGQSGNPSGRPGGTEGFAAKIRKLTGDGKKMLDFALTTLDEKALQDHVTKDGDVVRLGPSIADRQRAAEWLTDRMLGKAPQSMELTGKDGGPVEISDARERLAAKLAALLAASGESGAAGKPE